MSLVSSEWSEAEGTLQPTQTWVRAINDSTLDMALHVSVESSRPRARRGAVKDTIDGTREVRTAARLMRTGTITFVTYTVAEREQLDALLNHTGTVLIQLKPDEGGVGENLYVNWVDADEASRLARTSDIRLVSVGWAEVER